MCAVDIIFYISINGVLESILIFSLLTYANRYTNMKCNRRRLGNVIKELGLISFFYYSHRYKMGKSLETVPIS